MDLDSLVERARAGDKEAFAKLVRGLQDGFYRIAWSILRSDADAADALQETVLKCWLKLGELREPARFKTWATRILVNECRTLARKGTRVVPAGEMPEEAAPDSGYDLAEWQMALAALDERSRLVIALHYAQGYRVAEIARILGANENTVKTWLATARSRYEQLVIR